MNDDLTLDCQVSGDSTAHIQWTRLHQRGPLPNNVQIIGSVLRVDKVKSENGGVYRCTVNTYAGSYTGDYVLAIQGKSHFYYSEY